MNSGSPSAGATANGNGSVVVSSSELLSPSVVVAASGGVELPLPKASFTSEPSPRRAFSLSSSFTFSRRSSTCFSRSSKRFFFRSRYLLCTSA